MNIFIAFGWNEPRNEYGLSTPIGGAGDFIGASNTVEGCKEMIVKSHRRVCHIAELDFADLETKELPIVWFYENGEWWDNPQSTLEWPTRLATDV